MSSGGAVNTAAPPLEIFTGIAMASATWTTSETATQAMARATTLPAYSTLSCQYVRWRFVGTVMVGEITPPGLSGLSVTNVYGTPLICTMPATGDGRNPP